MGMLEMVRGLPQISHAEQFCDTCVLAKHRRRVFPKQTSIARIRHWSLYTAISAGRSSR
jgi:hypothetical protein